MRQMARVCPRIGSPKNTTSDVSCLHIHTGAGGDPPSESGSISFDASLTQTPEYIGAVATWIVTAAWAIPVASVAIIGKARTPNTNFRFLDTKYARCVKIVIAVPKYISDGVAGGICRYTYTSFVSQSRRHNLVEAVFDIVRQYVAHSRPSTGRRPSTDTRSGRRCRALSSDSRVLRFEKGKISIIAVFPSMEPSHSAR